MVDVIGRPAGDVLSRVVRVTLSGQEFRLPLRSIRFNREWKAQLDAQTTGIVDALVDAGDDWEKVVTQLTQDLTPFIDLLASYAPDVLSRDAIEDMEPDPSMDVINACREVWLAANPLVGIGIEALTAEISANAGSVPTSSLQPSTDGPTTTSSLGSPMSSSSPTSTLPPTASDSATRTRSTHASKRPGSARSSPTTRRRTTAGGTAPRKPNGSARSQAQPSRPQ